MGGANHCTRCHWVTGGCTGDINRGVLAGDIPNCDEMGSPVEEHLKVGESIQLVKAEDSVGQ